jgi:2-(1,2-epoxy-1,2-dihydrophenyl)acetyl-CoA isomerase
MFFAYRFNGGATMRADFQHVLVQQDNGVLTITMNRPEVLNSIHSPLQAELNEIAEAAASDETIRCVVLMGAGRGFGAGQDLKELKGLYEAEVVDPSLTREHLHGYHRLVTTLQEMPKPTIAALHGVATGVSLNIALACDLRIAAHETRFSEAFSRIGLVPDGGGAYFLTRLVGLGKALELSLLANEIDGQEAERIGLVNKSVPLAELEATTREIANRLAQGPTYTYHLIKQLVYTAHDKDLATVLALETDLQGKAFVSADHREGVLAFLQKRSPHFTGK